MDLKTVAIELLDCRPIKKVTLYAVGTALEGIAVGLMVAIYFPSLGSRLQLGIAASCFVVGALLATTSYSVLKRHYRIVPREQAVVAPPS